MSIIDETIKRLGDEKHPLTGNPSAPRSALEPMADLGFVVGPRKRSSTSLILALLLVIAGVAVYLWLPKPQSTEESVKEAQPQASAPAKPIAGIPVAISSVTAQAVVAETPPKQPAASEAEAEADGLVSAPNWYEAGWSGAGAGKWSNALSAWEDGVRGLPSDRMVIAANSYADLNAFSAKLKQYVKTFPVIGVRQRHYSGQVVYRLVVFPYGGGTREMLPKVQSVFSHAGLVNASYVQERMLVAKASKSAQVAEKAVPIQTGKLVAASPAKTASGETLQVAPASQAQPAGSTDAVANGTAPAAVAAEVNTWENRASAVRDLLKAEAYVEVARSAQTLAQDFPDRWESWFWLGTAQLAQGQMDAADTALARSSKLNPKVAQIWVQRAVVAQERGDHAAAVTLLNEARELSPKSPQIYLNLGYSNDALGIFVEAEKSYQRFLALTEGDEAYALQRKPVIERLQRKH